MSLTVEDMRPLAIALTVLMWHLTPDGRSAAIDEFEELAKNADGLSAKAFYEDLVGELRKNRLALALEVIRTQGEM